MRIKYTNSIPLDREKLTFSEWCLSLFSREYRRHKIDWRMLPTAKDKTKKIAVPYHLLWNPWSSSYDELYCVMNASLEVQASLKLAKENVKLLEKTAKEADLYCNNLINEFGMNCVGRVYGQTTADGSITWHEAAAKVSLADLEPAGSAKRREITERPVEPRNTNNNKGKGNQGQN